MELIQLRCPNCNADLKIENGLNTFYCQHCGTKIVLAEHPEIIRAKAEAHIADTNAELEKARLQHELELKHIEETKSKEEWRRWCIQGIIALLLFLMLVWSAYS